MESDGLWHGSLTSLAFNRWAITPAPTLSLCFITAQLIQPSRFPVLFPATSSFLLARINLSMIIPMRYVCRWGHFHGCDHSFSNLCGALIWQNCAQESQSQTFILCWLCDLIHCISLSFPTRQYQVGFSFPLSCSLARLTLAARCFP